MQRSSFGGRSYLGPLLLTHLLAVVSEWSVGIALLVHAHEWGGPNAVGWAAVALVSPFVLAAPLATAAIGRWRTYSVRVVAVAVQGLAYAAAAASVGLGAPTPVVATFAVMGVAMMTVIPPTTAALLPRAATSAEQLVRGNLWMTHFDSASALIGSLLAGGIVGLGGPEAAFIAVSAAAFLGLSAAMFRPGPLVRSARSGVGGDQKRVLVRTLAELRAHPWSVGVLSLAGARNLIVGTFDVVLVVLAIDRLNLGNSGPGYLSALVGGGALISTAVTAIVVRGSHLRAALIASIVVAAVAILAMSGRDDLSAVVITLPIVGLCMALMDSLSRTMLQRSTDPRSLGPMLAALGFVAGAGQIAGSLLAQVVLKHSSAEAALFVLGSVLVLLGFASLSALRRADLHADVPSAEMALLAGVPMLSSIPTAGLEGVARSAVTIEVESGDVLVAESDRVNACFVVATGEFEISARGSVRGAAVRGDTIGDIALLTTAIATTTVRSLTAGSVVRIERQPFLVALTGSEVQEEPGLVDLSGARQRFREVVAAQERERRSASTDSAVLWLSLGAAGRTVGDPSFSEVVTRGASLAQRSEDTVLLAEAAAMTTWPGAFFFLAENPDLEMIDLCEKALASLGENDPMRARVAATLASHLTFTDDRSRRRRLIDEALQLATEVDDPHLLGSVLNAEFICMWDPSTLERREQIATAMHEIGGRIDDAELRYIGGFFAAYCLAERGDLRGANDRLTDLRCLVPLTQNQYFEFLGDRLSLSIDIALGRPDTATRIDALIDRHRGSYADTDGTWAIQIGALAYQAGTLHTMGPTIAAMLDGHLANTWRAALALAHATDGDRAAAIAVLDQQGEVPVNYFWLTVIQVQAEVAAILCLTDRCERLFRDLEPYRGRVGITASGSLCFGLVSRSLGHLALAMGRVDAALDLLVDAIAQADETGFRFESVIARRLLASALLAKGQPDEAERMRSLAVGAAREGGYQRESELLDALGQEILRSNARR